MKTDQSISALIVDDEPLSRHGLREILDSEKNISVIGEAHDGEEAVHQILKHHPDVVFLDIQMPEMNGFEVLKNIPSGKLPLIVFVTAYDEFAIKAFSTNALDYILKPYDPERVRSSLHRVKEMIRMKSTVTYSERMMEVLKSFQNAQKYPDRFSIRSAGKIYFVSSHEIVWIEAAADYIHLHTKNGKHITRETISSIEKQLDPSKFVRIHRSYIVSFDHIRELDPMHHGEYIALLSDGAKLTVSRTYKEKHSYFLK